MSAPQGRVGGIILAAGRGARMGQTKQLLTLRGVPLLAHVVAAAERSALDQVVLVLGHEAATVAAAAQGQRAQVAFNPRYAEGQSASLRVGLQALDGDIVAALVLLGDQPTVRAAAIDAIVEAYWQAGPPYPLVVMPTYGGRDGHPVLLARPLWAEVMAVRGDEGARSVIRAHPDAVRRVALPGRLPGDVDTPADYRLIQADGDDEE